MSSPGQSDRNATHETVTEDASRASRGTGGEDDETRDPFETLRGDAERAGTVSGGMLHESNRVAVARSVKFPVAETSSIEQAS